MVALVPPTHAATEGRQAADPLNFTLHKLAGSAPGPTLLVVGGIQGDEPGGFNAAALLVTRYTVSKGSIWVVPNLNFESIIKRSRGVHGDMNRKFSKIKTSDPEFEAVAKIKSIILDEQVNMVLNLHDGSGFYRHDFVDRAHNARRWGQSIVIDQEQMGTAHLQQLGAVAARVARAANRGISTEHHHYRVKNTRTREGNVEMAKTLTYFAVRNGTPAAGVEASKSLRVHQRVYYHLQVIEGYLRDIGIEFDRGFDLTMAEVGRQTESRVELAMYQNRIFLDFANSRKRVRYVPMKRDAPVEFVANSPLVAVVRLKGHFQVQFGNRRVTQLYPQYFDYDEGLDKVSLLVDGERIEAPLGTVVDVVDRLRVPALKDVRVNAIGFKRRGIRNEVDIDIRRQNFIARFSLDKQARVYRLEFYRGLRFAGMVLVRFVDTMAASRLPPAYPPAPTRTAGGG